MIFWIHPEVSKDIGGAFEWYEEKQSGLGHRFILETRATIYRLQYFSNLNPEIGKNIRRAILPDFPYGVIYSINDEVIEIYAIAHLHRKPAFWKKRK